MSLKRKQNGSQKTRQLKKQIENHKNSHLKQIMNIKLKLEIAGKNNQREN